MQVEKTVKDEKIEQIMILPAFEQSHKYCIMCGCENPYSLRLKFSPDEMGTVFAQYRGNKTLQGYEGVIHGGVLSAIMDTAMAHCLMHKNIKAVTGELNIRYLKPVPCSSRLEISAWIDSSLPPLYHMKSKIQINGGTVCKGKARFMAVLP